jgi:hypothetical protein
MTASDSLPAADHRDGPVCATDLAPDLMHIILFGPGTGEGIVIVLPDGSVGVVDGVCGDQLTTLLDELKVSKAGGKQLLFACLTHPHSDHYAGFAALVRDRRPTHLWWAGDEELRFFEAFCAVMKHREGESPRHAGAAPPKWMGIDAVRVAIEDSFKNERPGTRHRVLSDRKRLLVHAGVVFESILPTTSEKLQALRELIARGSRESASRDGEKVNDLSGALLLSWAGKQILLGGDCNAGSEEQHHGWAGHGETIGQVQILKAPHHGSETAWHEASYKEWKPAVVLLTPFQRAGVHQPPKPEEIDQLRPYCPRMFMSTPKDWQLSKLAAEGFEDARVPLTASSGVIRVSVDASGTIKQIALHGAAHEI